MQINYQPPAYTSPYQDADKPAKAYDSTALSGQNSWNSTNGVSLSALIAMLIEELSALRQMTQQGAGAQNSFQLQATQVEPELVQNDNTDSTQDACKTDNPCQPEAESKNSLFQLDVSPKTTKTDNSQDKCKSDNHCQSTKPDNGQCSSNFPSAIAAATPTATVVSPEVNKSDKTPAVQGKVVGTANGRFHTEGIKIIGPDGKEFIQNGINAKQAEWGRTSIEQEVSDAAAKGYNSIRITTNIGLDRVDQFIKEAGKYNLVVQVVNEGNGSGNIIKGDELKKNENLMAGIAKKYKDNPYVWLETQNEAGGYGTASNKDWLNMVHGLVAAIRSTGNTNPIVVDDTGWGSGDVNGDKGQSGLLVNAKALLALGNIIGSEHVYNRNSEEVAAQQITAAIQALHNAGLPMMIGEFGREISPEIKTLGGYNATIKVAPSLGVGALIFPN